MLAVVAGAGVYELAAADASHGRDARVVEQVLVEVLLLDVVAIVVAHVVHGGARLLGRLRSEERALGGRGQRRLDIGAAVEQRVVLGEVGALRAEYEAGVHVGQHLRLTLPVHIGHVGQLHPARRADRQLAAVEVVPGAAGAARLADADVVDLLERVVDPVETRGRVHVEVAIRMLELVVEERDRIARAALEAVAQELEVLLDKREAAVLRRLEAHLQVLVGHRILVPVRPVAGQEVGEAEARRSVADDAHFFVAADGLGRVLCVGSGGSSSGSRVRVRGCC